MALLGFGAQGCDKLENAFGGEEVCMYGTPIVEFHLSARVVDKDGNPIHPAKGKKQASSISL